MIRDLLRITGCACIIAGTILFFSTETKTENESENSRLKAEISTLQADLKTTSEELASLQLSIKEAETPIKKEKEVKEEAKIPSSDSTPKTESNQTILLIERGMDSTTVANKLENAGIIKNASQFEVDLAKDKLAGKIQIGEYELNASMSNEDIINMITSSN